jgi:hypothetical protein
MKHGYWVAAALIVLPLVAGNAAGPFDGKYNGERTVLRGSPPICPAPGNVTWTVADSRISLPFYATSVTMDVADNGSFQKSFQYRVGNGVQGSETWQGQITGVTLSADLQTGACQMHYALKKQ